MRRARRSLATLVLTIACACRGAAINDQQAVASLRLTCVPDSHGLRCQLLALSPNVARAPRDVTAEATWQFEGPTGATISPAGLLRASEIGAVLITATFRVRHAHAAAWLRPNAPGEMLGTVRGHVYVEQEGALRPLADVYVEVELGPNAGRWTTTAADGSYTLDGMRPGEGRIRAQDPLYVETDEDLDVIVGENRRNLLMSPKTGPPRRDTSTKKVVTL